MDLTTETNNKVVTNPITSELIQVTDSKTEPIKLDAISIHSVVSIPVTANTPASISLDVLGLKYIPGMNYYETSRDFLIRSLHVRKYFKWTESSFRSRTSVLNGINFRASAGKLTAVVGNSMAEVRTLIDLIVGRRKTGTFVGDISLSGIQTNISDRKKYLRNVAFIPHKTLYIPGLTYLETLRYAARLQLASHRYSSGMIESRVQEVMAIMDLQRVKNRIIPEFPSNRGELGRDMRLLSIALEIMSLPPLIVIDDPVLQLDAGVATKIFQCLHELSRRGHIILCGMPKPNPTIVPYIDNVILLSDGYSIYSASTRHLERYFCSPEVGYSLRKDVDIMDFIIDIASGTERPQSSRQADASSTLQEKYEQSVYFESPVINVGSTSVFSSDLFRLWGYGRIDTPITLIKHTWVIIDRAFVSKLKDKETIKRSLGSSIILSSVIGYIQYNQGNYGYYTMSILTFPYLGTANTTALIFFVNAFIFAQQVLNVHVICQKLQVFRYEQEAKYCTSLSFTIATILSEIPFTIFYAWVFGTIIYFLADLGEGFYNYFYFNSVLALLGIVGTGTALMFATVLIREIRVRDIFLLCIFLMVLLSGFPFQIPHITSYMNQISQINPIRWSFEALMAWKFQNYYNDGYYYLINFGSQAYPTDHIWETLGNFAIISFSVFFVLTLPRPIFLRKAPETDITLRLSQSQSQSNDSTGRIESDDKFDPNFNKTPSVRHSELAKPLIFARESSISQKSKLSLSITPFGEETAFSSRGPTVTFQDLTYRTKDRRSPLGYKTVLNNISGQFDWGKLSMILGASQSGKSSLLHILAGDVGLQSDITGDIRYNGRNVDPKKSLWQRCAMVEAHDEQYHDLTVKEVVTFAMKLRCLTTKGFTTVTENVNLTVEILHLDDILNKKVNALRRGERRRLSIAEEIVHGPSLLLIDEPTTHLDLLDESVMMMTFRELVNQDKTVITTSYQPSPASFKLFDDVVLLSKGRIIYAGPTANAIKFFINSPGNYDFSGYNINPGDFLIDISSGQLVDSKGIHNEATALESYYQSTDGYIQLINRLNKMKLKTTPAPAAANASVLASSSVVYSHHYAYTSSSTQPAAIATLSSSSSSHPSPSGSMSMTLPNKSGILANEVNPLRVSDSTESKRESFDVETANTISNTKIRPMKSLHTIIFEDIKEFFQPRDLKMSVAKAWVILHRSSLGLWNRWQLVLGSLCIYIILACIFGWIIGDCSQQVYNTTSFFAVAPLLLFIANILYISYIFKSNEVFLKEQSRGLYSNFLYWIVAPLPLYVLQIINAIVFSVIVFTILNLNNNSSVYRYFVGMNVIAVLASFLMSELIIYSVADIRSAYLVIPGLVLIQFAFSGLFIKTGSLPGWLSPWAPSASMIRWALEGNFINQFEDNSAFPVFTNGFSTYVAFLDLFTWQGQSKWLCINNLLYFMLVFKIGAFVSNSIVTMYQKGGRSFKKIEDE